MSRVRYGVGVGAGPVIVLGILALPVLVIAALVIVAGGVLVGIIRLVEIEREWSRQRRKV